MKNEKNAWIIHTFIWLLLLIIPYASTDQVFNLLDPASDVKYFLFCLILSLVLISAFYSNYCFLIPRYLLPGKHKHYFSLLLLAVITVFSISGLLFLYFFKGNGSSAIIVGNPIVEKLVPIIITNAISLWFLAIVSSILLEFSNKLKRAESERLSAQIAFLRSQINPHFLFNTLNNIYAMAIDTSPKAADMIDRLSEMMRYTMKHAQQDFVRLDDEIKFIGNFIELQRVRLNNNVKLTYSGLQSIPSLKIAPMLLIPFIENAFKYGVNPEQKSHIKIEITLNNGSLRLTVLNKKVTLQQDISHSSGLGIANTRNRLDLIYPSKNSLEINDNVKVFCVSLKISLQ